MKTFSETEFTPLLHQQVEKLLDACERGKVSRKALSVLAQIPYHQAVSLAKRFEDGSLTVQDKTIPCRAFLNLLICTKVIEAAIEEGELPRRTQRESVEWAESITPARE